MKKTYKKPAIYSERNGNGLVPVYAAAAVAAVVGYAAGRVVGSALKARPIYPLQGFRKDDISDISLA
ncbi:hypothetical protein [Megasphaera stantonii]|uniref:hypothetical protein n=1 Tax=Megasphaera stantonii TaxID=2144175 RepID=UPI00320AAB39